MLLKGTFFLLAIFHLDKKVFIEALSLLLYLSQKQTHILVSSDCFYISPSHAPLRQ
jgi:hypothetical protein